MDTITNHRRKRVKLIEEMSLEELLKATPHRILHEGNSYYLSIRAYDNDTESQFYYQVSWQTLLDEKLYDLSFFGASVEEALGCALINYKNNNSEQEDVFSNVDNVKSKKTAFYYFTGEKNNVYYRKRFCD